MAVKRTPQERKEIAMRCVEIEKEDGDVLEYLRSENYISPRATWIKLQREVLRRAPSRFTSGKPQKKGEKKMSGKTMDARLKRLESLKKQINDGVNIRAALSSMGYTGKSAGPVYRQIRNLAKERDPDFYARMPEKISDVGAPVVIKAVKEPDAVLGRPKEDFEQMPTVKVDGPIRIETPEANRVEIVEVPEKQVTPKITVPTVFDGMTIREVEGLFGRYRYSDIGSAVYIDYENAEGVDVLSLTVDQWRRFREEQEKAAAILGVEL